LTVIFSVSGVLGRSSRTLSAMKIIHLNHPIGWYMDVIWMLRNAFQGGWHRDAWRAASIRP